MVHAWRRQNNKMMHHNIIKIMLKKEAWNTLGKNNVVKRKQGTYLK